MVIAHISLYPGRSRKHIKASGVASYTKNLIDSIPHQAGDNVYVICDKLDGKAEQYQEDGLTIVRAFDRDYRVPFQLFKAIRRINPDVVHIQQELPLYGPLYTAFLIQLLVMVLRLQKRRVVITLHHVVDIRSIDRGFVTSNNSSAPAWLVRLAFRLLFIPLIYWANRVVVHEGLFKRRLVEQYRTSAGKITVIPHGVEDFEALDRQEARRHLGIDQDKQVMLFMGYLAGYKGFDLLLEGFAHYAKTHPQAYLVIGAGMHPKLENDPAYLKDYRAKQAKAEELIPASKYRWIGFIEEAEVKYYYSASDVSLYPYSISLSSSGPMSFAMGYEKPFLASDVFADVMPADIIFARQPQAMSGKLQAFFEKPHVWAGIARRMKTERLWSNVGTKTRNLYQETAS